MSSLKKLGALLLAITALGAVGGASASASEFTASETGSLTGSGIGSQDFAVSGGIVSCLKAEPSGTVSKKASTSLHVTVKFSSCSFTAMFLTTHVSPATLQFTAEGFIRIENTVTITPTVFGASACTITITPQTGLSANYKNFNKRVYPASFLGFTNHSTGGICGGSSVSSTYSGELELGLASGGTLSYDL